MPCEGDRYTFHSIVHNLCYLFAIICQVSFATNQSRMNTGSMQYLALVPYFMILAGVELSHVGMLPALKGWMLISKSYRVVVEQRTGNTIV